jgi:hypothetical protein
MTSGVHSLPFFAFNIRTRLSSTRYCHCHTLILVSQTSNTPWSSDVLSYTRLKSINLTSVNATSHYNYLHKIQIRYILFKTSTQIIIGLGLSLGVEGRFVSSQFGIFYESSYQNSNLILCT